MHARFRFLTALGAFALSGCGPDLVAASGGDETGDDVVTLSPAHWLVYATSLPEPNPVVSLRAVDLGGLAQGELGPPIELLEGADYRAKGPTPGGAYAFTLDRAYMLVGLDADGQIEVNPGVPAGVPAKAGDPKYSADGSVALFRGESGPPLDSIIGCASSMASRSSAARSGGCHRMGRRPTGSAPTVTMA